MKDRIKILLFIIILTLAFVTRFYKLGEAPAGLYLDEAAQGYNAYSILKTGKDEFGKSFPVVFRSFTDFKTPVYIYILVPLIKIFDLTKFTVRLPSALFSLLTFPVLYLLIKKLTPKNSMGNGKWKMTNLTAILLAVSPWHVLFGRTNFETNVALFFFLAGVFFFYKGLEKPLSLLISAVMFAAAIPSYHSQRVITPLIMLVLFIKHRKKLLQKKYRKFLYYGMVIGLLILLPTLFVSTTPGFLRRASGLNIFSHERQKPAGHIENCQGFYCPIVNNSIYLSTKEFAALYTSYFSPRNMFLLGDSGPRSSFPKLSTFFLWQSPFNVYGLWILFKKKKLGELRFFTIALLLIAPIPAAVTRDPYSTIRSEPLVIPQLIIISIGIIYSYKFLKNHIPHPSVTGVTLVIGLSIGIIGYSLLKLYSSVIILNEHYRAEYWNYGWEEVSETIQTLDTDPPIIVDNSRTEPYSQLLFFLKFDPETYQEENFEVPLDEYYTNLDRNKTKKIGNIITRPIDWEKDVYKKQYLIGDALSISGTQIEEHNLEQVKESVYPDWSRAFIIVETNPVEKCLQEGANTNLCN